MKAAAIKSIPFGGPRPGAKMWWTDTLSEQQRDLERLHLTLNSAPAERHEEITEAIVAKRRAFSKSMAEVKKLSWTRSCDNLHSTHEAFQVIAAMRGKRRKEASCAISTPRGFAVTPEERAQAHLKQFQSASTPSPEYKQRARQMVTTYRQRINRELGLDHAEMPLFKMADLQRALAGCKRGKAPGRDELPMELYLEGGVRLHTWFLILTNKALVTQEIPHDWRHHEWIAVRKPGKDPQLATSYRPITLMCTGAKLMEKLVLGRLEAAVPTVCPLQFGYRANHSVHTAVATLSNHIQHTLGTKSKQATRSRDRHHATAQYVHKGALLSLDVAGAFDKVNPYHLCSKLLDAGIQPRLVKLISSFLLDKRHSVRVGGFSTRLARIPLGLPQGSALAPWLYSFFTADALHALSQLKNTTVLAYADDLP
eukprot:6456332-Amphidinium_carterae.1